MFWKTPSGVSSLKGGYPPLNGFRRQIIRRTNKASVAVLWIEQMQSVRVGRLFASLACRLLFDRSPPLGNRESTKHGIERIAVIAVAAVTRSSSWWFS
ncbi:hypothetical protein KC322_g81 [Hortaea werneckii]|nr:hypothetical protein KC322_g81 [Hortaea werneckii]